MNTKIAPKVAPNVSFGDIETLTLSLNQEVDVSVTLVLAKDRWQISPTAEELMLTRRMLDDIFRSLPFDQLED